MQKDTTNILKRYHENPILDPKDYPGVAQIFNPGVAEYNGKTILLVSMIYFKQEKINNQISGGVTKVAESDDGVHFKIRDEIFIDLRGKEYPYNMLYRHTIDNRVTKIDDTYYMVTPTTPTDEWFGSVAILGKTKDFQSYEAMEIIALPPNRGVSLFPEKINGKYYRLDRPGSGTGSKGHIWLSSSPDLIHWGCHRPVLHPYNYWNSSKIGPTPPIKTEKGWLVIIHGVSTSCDGSHYYIGAVLLDIKKPWKVIGKTASWLLAPEEDYETCGVVDNVVFPCGIIANREKDEIRLYYGSADTRISLATGKLSDVIRACIDEA